MAAIRKTAVKENSLKGELMFTNYYRIAAYHPKEDYSIIVDSNGRYEKLWQFSAELMSKGFKIIEVGNKDNLVEVTFPFINEKSDKILLRAIWKGEPELQDFEHQNRPCRSIALYKHLYGKFLD